MAERDINIPFGPDKTGSMPAIEDGAAQIAPETDGIPAIEAGGEGENLADRRGGDADASQLDEVQSSFLALKDSIGQGRELKARERDREELRERIKKDREELADRENIIANYQSVVGEQDAIIAQNTQQREMRKAELARVSAEASEAQDALERMRDYHDQQLNPLETELGRARATAEQAKNDERSRKAELNAAEKEAERAEGGDSKVASAKVQVFEDAYNEAVARSNAAKELLDQTQKAYDDACAQVEQAEAPLERSIDDMNSQIEELKESINRLGDSISAATKRRQYCDSVYQYPDETAKLRQSVESDEALARQMDTENKELRGRLAESKKKAKTAKIAIGAVIAIVVIMIIAFIVVSVRGF